MTDGVDVTALHEMRIRALVMDPVSSMPVIILERTGGGQLLPIWIGLCEANAIALRLEGVETPRPMTHDLIVSLLERLGQRLERVVVHTLSGNVFFAALHLASAGGERLEIDSRPSDAIAIAVRTGAPIFVTDAVLREAHAEAITDEETLRAILERLRPEDLGQYEM